MSKKSALITWVTGQDGAYLAQLLLEKWYDVYGIVRRLSTPNFWRTDYLWVTDKINFIDWDLVDQYSLDKAVEISQPDEIYNLAAQSFVRTSWDQPILTWEATWLGTVKMLNAVKNFKKDAKFYQASTSEMYWNSHNDFSQDEQTAFHPCSPYAIAKLYAHWMCVNYRESYGMFVCSWILFNHESPLRWIEFVTRKVTDWIAKIKFWLSDNITLWNLDSKRDWWFAWDYVKAMWLMLQQQTPDDYVVATWKNYTIRQLLDEAFKNIWITDWSNYVKQDPKYMRPSELHILQWVPNKAMQKLDWKPEVTFEQLIKMMVDADLKRYECKISCK